jgi:hypothetical protein
MTRALGPLLLPVSRGPRDASVAGWQRGEGWGRGQPLNREGPLTPTLSPLKSGERESDRARVTDVHQHHRNAHLILVRG